jgi:hypothetical protein
MSVHLGSSHPLAPHSAGLTQSRETTPARSSDIRMLPYGCGVLGLRAAPQDIGSRTWGQRPGPPSIEESPSGKTVTTVVIFLIEIRGTGCSVRGFKGAGPGNGPLRSQFCVLNRSPMMARAGHRALTSVLISHQLQYGHAGGRSRLREDGGEKHLGWSCLELRVSRHVDTSRRRVACRSHWRSAGRRSPEPRVVPAAR